MDFRIHIGAHRTATQHLRSVLDANRALLEEQGICLPEAEQAERAFARALKRLKADDDIGAVHAELVATLTGDEPYERIVMIDPNVSGTVMRPFGKEFFYPRIATTVTRITAALYGEPVRWYAGIRNPASFIPSCYGASLWDKPELSFKDYLSDANIESLRWSDFLHRVQLKKTDIDVTTWRFEDYPFIWRDVAQALTGIENREKLVGTTTPVDVGISLRGAVLEQQFIAANPVESRDDHDQIRKAIFQKFPSDMGFEDETYWSAELISELTDRYEDDWYYIERMERVEIVTRPQFDWIADPNKKAV